MKYILPVPYFVQPTETTCQATSCKMLAVYYDATKNFLSEEDIKKLIKTSNLTYKEFKQYVRALASTPLRYKADIDIIENNVVKVKKGDDVEEFFFDKLIFSKDEEYITIVLKENFKGLIMDLKKEFSKHGLKEFFMLNGKYTKFLFMHLNRWKLGI